MNANLRFNAQPTRKTAFLFDGAKRNLRGHNAIFSEGGALVIAVKSAAYSDIFSVINMAFSRAIGDIISALRRGETFNKPVSYRFTRRALRTCDQNEAVFELGFCKFQQRRVKWERAA
jgi:hypothetical protein